MSREHLEDARTTFQMICATTEADSASANLAAMGAMICQALLDIDADEVKSEAWEADARDALAVLDRIPTR